MTLPHPHNYEPVKIAPTNRSVVGREKAWFGGGFQYLVGIRPAPEADQ